jgi:signal transduction histidine kinase
LLDERLRFESLLARLSTAFIRLPAEAVDSEIERGLRQIAEFLGIDRSGLVQFSEDGSELIVTHSFARPGVHPFPRVNLAPLLPWYSERIRCGEVLRFARLPDQLPPEAIHERAHCLREGLRSHMVIPLNVGESILGGIGFSSFRRQRDWPDGLGQSLQLVGEIFANALARKRAEQHATRLRDQLALLGRVTLMGQLGASIAHEVNQPLCAIATNAEAVQRMLGGEHCDLAEVREALADITRDGRRASTIIARIRGFARTASKERAPLAVNDLIPEACALMRSELARRGIAVKLDLAAELPLVRGDRVQLQQVILNLMANGADAMDRVARELRELSLRTTAEGTGVCVAVKDVGVGIDPRIAGRIFDTLFTTKPGGMGMGLAICKTIIEAHRGRIAARPNHDRGTTFQFTLPEIREATS